MIVLQPTDFLKAKAAMIGALSGDQKRRKIGQGKWAPVPKKKKNQAVAKKTCTGTPKPQATKAGASVDHVSLREDLDREYGGAFVDKLIHGNEGTLQSYLGHSNPKVAKYAKFHLDRLKKKV